MRWHSARLLGMQLKRQFADRAWHQYALQVGQEHGFSTSENETDDNSVDSSNATTASLLEDFSSSYISAEEMQSIVSSLEPVVNKSLSRSISLPQNKAVCPVLITLEGSGQGNMHATTMDNLSESISSASMNMPSLVSILPTRFLFVCKANVSLRSTLRGHELEGLDEWEALFFEALCSFHEVKLVFSPKQRPTGAMRTSSSSSAAVRSRACGNPFLWEAVRNVAAHQLSWTRRTPVWLTSSPSCRQPFRRV